MHKMLANSSICSARKAQTAVSYTKQYHLLKSLRSSHNSCCKSSQHLSELTQLYLLQSMADDIKVDTFIHHIFHPLPSDSADDKTLPGCRSIFALQHAMEHALQQVLRTLSQLCLCMQATRLPLLTVNNVGRNDGLSGLSQCLAQLVECICQRSLIGHQQKLASYPESVRLLKIALAPLHTLADSGCFVLMTRAVVSCRKQRLRGSCQNAFALKEKPKMFSRPFKISFQSQQYVCVLIA